jgi:DNA-binding response OmpR family regulator
MKVEILIPDSCLTLNKQKEMKRRILIVDDDPDNNRVFTIALSDNGFEVDAFNDPELALSAFNPDYYDLLILDIRLPKMDGYELYDEIKKIDNKAVVCFLTAYGVDKLNKPRSSPTLSNGISFMRKPIAIDELVKNVDEIIIQADKQK